MFRYVDLFCGIGGFHVALESLGGKCVFASDIDKECQKMYNKNFGIMPIGDIRSVQPADIPDHDILCGGFPCQPFSNAGNKNAFDDTRGTLFQTIADIVSVKKPKILILENVKHIKSIQKGHVYNTIYKVFEDIGYVMKDVILSPHSFGIPQKRERVYFIAVRNDLQHPGLPHVPVSVSTEILLNNTDAKYTISKELHDVFSAWDEIIPVLSKTKMGVPIILDYFKLDATSDMKDWKQTYIHKNRALYDEHASVLDAWMEKYDTLLSKRAVYRKLEWQTGGMKSTDSVLKNHFIQVRQSGIRVKNATTFPTLVAIVQTSIVGDQMRYLTPRECARLQSFPDTHVLHEKDRIAYKQLGNSVNVNVVHHVAKFVISKVLDS